jgi:5-hydroxyisourate hydrolase-like protein (transthyretin family)
MVDRNGNYIDDLLEKLVDSSWVEVTSATTDSNGYATLSWTEDSPGNYTYHVVYHGRDYVYNASVSEEFNVTFTQIITGLTLSSNTSRAYVDEPVLLTARLVYDSTPLANETVYF